MAARLLPPGHEHGGLLEHSAHAQTFGPLPLHLTPKALLSAVADSGLTGRGGAAFPTHRKLAQVAGGRDAVVVGNAAEGEPASAKDAFLLRAVPHLVLDGLQVAARAVGATEVHLVVRRGLLVDATAAVARTRFERGIDLLPVRVSASAGGFVDGEESALIAGLEGGPALPRSKPPMVGVRGYRGRPTLVQNVETLGHLALIARGGPVWFRQCGTAADPGTRLLSVSSAATTPLVIEVESGVPLADVLRRVGLDADPAAVLLGGFHGTWLPVPNPDALALSSDALAARGARIGAGVVRVLPRGACGITETARIVRYLAAQSAQQCGPCRNGLPALAQRFEQLATSRERTRAVADLQELSDLVDGRGACRHPDGTVRLVRSALTTFASEAAAHAAGRCVADSSAARPKEPAWQ